MIYLVRANADGVCWCSCPEAPVVPPGAGQLPCPWCGCGWLFTCILCRRAFTFAKAVEIDLTPELVIQLDRQRCDDGTVPRGLRPELRGILAERDQRRRNVFAANHLKHLKVGEEYAYLDGCVLPVHPGKRVRIEVRGLYGVHRGDLPQAVHREDPKRMGEALGRSYWERAHALAARVS